MEFDGDNLEIERYKIGEAETDADNSAEVLLGGAKSLEERLAAAIVRADRARDTANRMVRVAARERALDRVARLDEKTDLIRAKIQLIEQRRREKEEIIEIKRQTAAAKKAEEKQIRAAQRAIKKAETKERARLRAIAKRAADREARNQAREQAVEQARAAERKREEEEEKKKIFENNLFFIVDVSSATFSANNLITIDLTPAQIREARGDKDNRIYMAHKNSPAAKELTKYLRDRGMLNGSNTELRSLDEERENSPLQQLLLNAIGLIDRFYVEHSIIISGLNFPDYDEERGIFFEDRTVREAKPQGTLLETMTDVLRNAIQGARDYILKADDYIELPFKYFNGRHYERKEYVPNPEWSDETNKFQKGIFDNNNVIHPCVVNVLINKYSKLGSNICISEKSITQFFEDAAYGLKDQSLRPPSIGLLCDFCKLYNIELHIYDIFKKRFIYEENTRDNRKTNKRPPLICMCFDNHIYNYTLPPTKEINFTMKPMDEYDYENCPINFTKIIIDERADEILKLVQPNFTAPYDVQKMRAISYTFPDAGGLGDNFMPSGGEGSAGEGIYTIDLVSAYYNAQTEFYKYTGVKCLPCFSACDIWKVETPPGSGSGLVAVGYYRIDEEAFNFIRRFYGICGNLLSDFLINFFITNKMMKLSNVIAYKTASYTLPTELLAKRMRELVNKIKEEYKGNLIKDFSIFNGIFGYTRTNRTQHAEISKLDDIKLIALNHPEAIASDNTSTKIRSSSIICSKAMELIQENDRDISMREKKRFCFDMYDYPIDTITTTAVMINKETEHRYFNSLNIYNYTVDITNLLICMKIKQLRDGGFRILKAMTDDITFRAQTNLDGRSVIITPELLGIRPPQTPNGDPDQNYPSIFKLKDNKPGRSAAPCVKYEFSQLITDQQNSFENIGDNIKGYQGAPGVGKTYTVQHNHTYDYAMTTTNICARNMDSKNADGVEIIAKTLYSAFKIYEQHKIEENLSVFRNKTIWLDEYSLMKKYMWSFIYVLAIKFNVSFIISGDIYQLPPVSEKSIAIDLHDKFFSTIFKNIITLEDGKYSRNDAELIELRNCINELQRGERATRYKGKIFHRVGDLITSLHNSGNCGSSIDNTKMPIADNFICYTNEYKDFLNAEIMKAKAHTVKADFVKTATATTASAVFRWECSTGAIISPVCNRKSIIRPNLYKNDRYKVVKGGSGDSPDDEIIVQVIRLVKSQPPVGCNVIDYDFNDPTQSPELDPNTTITLKSIELGLMAPSYAFTCHCSQGMTLEGLLEIHQCDDIEKMNYRDNSGSNWIYTAATRSRALANIKFVNKSEIFTKLPKKQRGEIITRSLKEFFDVSGIQPKLLSKIDKEFSQMDELQAV
jgi:hypothetical protein